MSALAVFDLYGTLLDYGGLASRIETHGIDDARAFVLDWRRKQIEYAFCTTLSGVWHDFDVITARALDYVLEARGIVEGPAGRAALADLWRELPAYDDVVPALGALRDAGVQRYVLTNGVRASALDAVDRAGLRSLVTDVLSVEAVRAYKPDPRVYGLITTRSDLPRAQIVFVSSNGWDAAGAATFGFRVAWCNRQGAPPESLFAAPATMVRTLAEIPPLFGP